MERLKQRVRPVSWWSLGFLMLITSLLLSVFVAPLARAADDTYSVSGGTITIQSEIFIGGTYTDGDTNPQIKCSPNAATAIVAISQESKNKIKNGETPDVIRYSITPNGGAANNSSCPSGDRTAQYMEDTDGDSIDNAREACAIEGFGWAICGPSMWIAKGMDTVYGWLEGFLEIQPLETTNTSSIVYQAWDIMRGFANAAFIIAFIFIIYSQITSVGISNYGIKKLAPRLVVAAILVNLSFYICSIGIDLANIAGHGVKNIFDNILLQLLEGSTAGATDTNANRTGDIIQAVLSGTTITVGGLSLVGGSLFAAAPVVLILLLTLFVSAIVALLVLSARQAILIILVIISPLAFVAYLLPGTEKWFEKWRNVLFTMLVFFPAFAAVFGGANLVGIIISETAGSSVIRFVLGWAVQLAPLAITPLIMKLGGGMLNRFAGIVNDPTKGFMDKAKQQARDQSQVIAAERRHKFEKRAKERENSIGKDGQKRGRKWWDSTNAYNPVGLARRMAIANDHRERHLKDRLADAEQASVNSYHGSERYERQNVTTRQRADQGTLLDNLAENRYNEMKSGTVSKAFDNVSDKRREQLQEQAVAIRALYNSNTASKISQENTARALSDQFSDDMLKDQDLQRQAEGLYEFGIDTAKSSATATQRSNFGKSVGENAELMKHFKLSSEQRQNLLRGIDQDVKDENGNIIHSFKANNPYAVEAALNEQLAVGTVTQLKEIVAMSGSGQHLAEYRGTISEGLGKSGSGKAAFFGGRLIDEVYQGNITGEAALENYIREWVDGGKFKSAAVSNFDKEALELLQKSIGPAGSSQRNSISKERLLGLRKKINEVFSNPDLISNVADNALAEFKKLRDSLPPLPEESGTDPRIG